jgi:hypothetical protein
MKNETNTSGKEQQEISELEQYTSTGANTEKAPWNTPRLNTLQVSQETNASSGSTPVA